MQRGFKNHNSFLVHRLKHVAPATLRGGILYHFTGFPGLYESEPDKVVEGELVWVVPEEYDVALAELDRLEEYFGDGTTAGRVCPPHSRPVAPIRL